MLRDVVKNMDIDGGELFFEFRIGKVVELEDDVVMAGEAGRKKR